MDNEPAAPRTRAKLSPEAIEKVRREWGPWAKSLTTQPDYAEAATEAAIAALEIEGAITVGAGIVLRSRVLLAGGGAAMAVVSLRALLTVAQAGYLFAAFAAVALVLLVVATALALGRDRYRVGAQGMREEFAQWD